ncbi:hypothetical protein AN958_02252 [Leucoagaricus sp. SymC.cos]|nr:hypothetical protein AN958_02252 [Leucoagaricus sp. SymC.cos]
MRLTLSTRHPRNSAYTTESGVTLYKVDKPRTIANGTATIRKAVGTVHGVWQDGSLKLPDSDRPKSPFSDKEDMGKEPSELNAERRSVDGTFTVSDLEDEGGDGPNTMGKNSPALEGHFAFIAQVEFQTLESTRFHFDGRSVSVADYFRKQGWSSYGRDRIFMASDGREYRWQLGARHLKLVTNDNNKKQIAKYRDYHISLGPLLKGRPASLEVDSSVEPILDEIMMTFVYCQKLREDREGSTLASNSAAASSSAAAAASASC